MTLFYPTVPHFPSTLRLTTCHVLFAVSSHLHLLLLGSQTCFHLKRVTGLVTQQHAQRQPNGFRAGAPISCHRQTLSCEINNSEQSLPKRNLYCLSLRDCQSIVIQKAWQLGLIHGNRVCDHLLVVDLEAKELRSNQNLITHSGSAFRNHFCQLGHSHKVPQTQNQLGDSSFIKCLSQKLENQRSIPRACVKTQTWQSGA